MVKEKPIPAGGSFPQRLAPPESRPKMEPLATSAQPPLPLLPHQRSPHAPPPGLRSPSQSCGVEQSPRQSPGWPLAGEALPDAGLGSCTDPGSNPGSASYQLRDPDKSLKGAKPLLPTLEREGDNSSCLLGCGPDAVRGHQQWRAQGGPPGSSLPGVGHVFVH